MKNRSHSFLAGVGVAALFIQVGSCWGATLVSRATTWRYAKGTREASDPRSEWRAIDFDDSGWAKGQAPVGYPSASVNTLLSDMQNTYSTLFLRKTFTVSAMDADTRLRAAVKYDDAFILWINGERVWDKNEPDGPPVYDSVAGEYGDSAGGYETNALPDPADYLELGENVVAVQLFNSSVGSGDGFIDVELSTYKRVADTTFSHDRGFYDASFYVTIATATPGATLRYTTDGSAPSATHGTVAGTNAAAVPITTTTCLRAAAFKTGYEPTDVDTQTYIFADDVLDQTRPSGFPTTFYNATYDATAPVTYDMNSTLVNAYGRTAVKNSLKSLPTLSVVGSYADMFVSGGALNCWSNQQEFACSTELIYPDGAHAGFQIDCGIRGHKTWETAKITRRLLFKSEFGPSKLRYPFFESAPVHADKAVDRFDRLVLRAGANCGVASSTDNCHRTLYARDPFVKASQVDAAGIGSQTTFVHLYFNGLYWGLYNVCERPDHSFASEHLGGEKEDWFACNHGFDGYKDTVSWAVRDPEPINGDRARYDYLISVLIKKDLTVPANYAELGEYVNMQQMVDYMLVNFYSGTKDWPGNNWYGGFRQAPVPEPMLYFTWDAEGSLSLWGDFPNFSEVYVLNVKAYVYNSDHARMWRQADNNADFRMLVADRAYKHTNHDGALTDANSRARFMAICDMIEPGFMSECVRWGTYKAAAGDPVTTNDWYAERDNIYGLLGGAGGRLKTLLRNNSPSLYPSMDPPAFLPQHGGAVAAGFKLTMSNPNSAGAVYYTLDGSDPRRPGGSRSPDALAYAGSLALSRTTHVKARVWKTNSTWSPVHAATYNYTAHYGAIRITEIMYNPLGGRDFEFVEIKNTGSSTRGLSEMTFKGIRYTFPAGTDLAGEQTLVLAANAAAFMQRYGTAPFGEYAGGLDNGGERLALLDCDGCTVTAVRYNDKDPWPKAADGDGHSLVSDGTGDQDDPANWRASNLIGGSPGYDDGAPCRVVISEALTHTDPPQVDAIELRNVGDTAADIGGWYLSDSQADLKKFQIPAGTALPAGGYAVFDESDFNTDTNNPACFALDSHGDAVYLTKWDASGNLQVLERAVFGAAANGRAFARHVMSDGDVDFPAQSTPTTLGAANAYPLVGPVVINEIMYHPSDLSDLADLSDEFIELHNTTGASVKLYDAANPANTWRLTNAVDYVFGQGIELGAGEYVLVIATNETVFRARYPTVPAGVRCFGPYSGRLGNGGERVLLVRPDTPDPDGIPWLEVDRVTYNDNSPWPESPDREGKSLERISATLYGNDPANWAASADAGGTPGVANSGMLVSRTSGWRFHDRGENLGTAWQAPAYEHGGWEHGNAPLGYPETDPALDTVVAFGADPANKHRTTYFRKIFALDTAASTVTALSLDAKYDDGYVAYLNGQEVARGGMPAGTVSCDTPASANGGSQGAYERKDLTAHIGKLVAGLNVLAVEVHQVTPDSSDLFMDLELSCQTAAVSPPAAPSGLAASAASSSRINLTWTDASANETGFKLDRRQSGASEWVRIANPAAGVTAYTDAGLPAGTTFYYKVRATNATGDSDYSATVSAATLPPFQPFTAYNDLAWFSGQLAANITAYTTTNGDSAGVRSGQLLDYASGRVLGVTLTVDGGANVWEQGAEPASGTDADRVFDGRVSGTGIISYGVEDLTLTLSGLDAGFRYELVLYANRGGSAYTGGAARWLVATLEDAAGYQNTSTAGTEILTTHTAGDTTRYNAGYNTLSGYVARFEQIDPGPDGRIVLRAKQDSGTACYPYASALMLRVCETADETVAVGKGAAWRYRKGTAEASAPAAAWRAVGYDDSGWATGPAPFGYGDGPYGTTLTDMLNSYTSLFLRREFSVEQSAAITELRLWALYDDGFILWVNGQEIARQAVAGATGSFTPYDGTAETAVGDDTEWTATLNGGALPALRPGINVLAVQVFNASAGSSDVTFDCELTVVRGTLPVENDDDRDRMPDDWESAALGGTGADADDDPDGDGLSNYQEYVAGTDPAAGADCFAVNLELNAAGLLVSFPTVPANGAGYDGLTRHYALEACQGVDGSGSWLPAAGCADVIGAGQTVVYTNATPSAGTYYRARVWLSD
ncbi:MAG: lamin tail domain-containing protein [Kiritimatiellae bacterium]|nr:lamin tail domain-containing protein [Kiritimatiellia bacterium]